jgi:hypothetical protein
MVEKRIAGAVAVGLTITLAGAGWARGIRSRWLASSMGMAGAVRGGDLADSQGGRSRPLDPAGAVRHHPAGEHRHGDARLGGGHGIGLTGTVPGGPGAVPD